MPSVPALLEIDGLHVRFPLEGGAVYAVQDVSLSIPRGRTVGLVGESGSGKTMTGLSLLRLVPPPGVVSGRILYYGRGASDASEWENGRVGEWESSNGSGSQSPIPPLSHSGPADIASLPADGEGIRSLRGREIAMVFQEPMTSLTPVYTIGQQICEMVRLHRRLGRREAWDAAIEMLRRVGIPAPEQRVDEYPHQLSGGMRQRCMIAMALSCNPALLIADEPTTALDVTVQAQILDLLRELQAELGMAILLISHDLGVIADLADEVAVMYAGKIVEQGSAEAIFYEPRHPYTQGLLRSAPVLGRERGTKLYAIPGTVPSLRSLPKSCAFLSRCDCRFERCLAAPELVGVSAGHSVRCWREGAAGFEPPRRQERQERQDSGKDAPPQAPRPG